MAKIYAWLPAAGSGARMGTTIAKQYLPLLGRPMIYHSLNTLCACPLIERVHVILSVDDVEWNRHDWVEFSEKIEVMRCGGDTRSETVLNGLSAAYSAVSHDDWALVHDAARPCLARSELETLIGALREDEVGGLLAVPLADTLKRTNKDGRVAETVPRPGLWQAQTPQMFRYGLLRRALTEARDRGLDVTDESRAIEALGRLPMLVPGDPRNFKVTYPRDLNLAEMILGNSRQEKSGAKWMGGKDQDG